METRWSYCAIDDSDVDDNGIDDDDDDDDDDDVVFWSHGDAPLFLLVQIPLL